MNIFYMAIKNLKKNFSFYSLYLLSVSFVITVFFAFTSFSVNKIMLEKISTDGRVESMCNVISIFLMAFVIFYMAYSNRFNGITSFPQNFPYFLTVTIYRKIELY